MGNERLEGDARDDQRSCGGVHHRPICFAALERAYRAMSTDVAHSVAVIGGGIVGLAVARELGLRYEGLAVTVIEKELDVARHQSGHNSGVVHAGLYYKPGSLKATLCRRGGAMLREFCQEHGVAYRELGKLVVATSVDELDGLADIEQRSHDNGVPDVRRIGPGEMADIEPFAVGVAALHSPHTAAVDYVGVCRSLVKEIKRQGGEVLLGQEVSGIAQGPNGVTVAHGALLRTFDRLVVCAGLQGDRVAHLAALSADLRIIPFRGEYYACVRRPRTGCAG